MYTYKQQAINHFLDLMNEDETSGNYNKVDEVVWVNANKMMAVLKEQALLRESVETRLPPAYEADWDTWDTNDTKEFDRLLHKIIFKERMLH